jgi:hypothetical protein
VHSGVPSGSRVILRPARARITDGSAILRRRRGVLGFFRSRSTIYSPPPAVCLLGAGGGSPDILLGVKVPTRCGNTLYTLSLVLLRRHRHVRPFPARCAIPPQICCATVPGARGRFLGILRHCCEPPRFVLAGRTEPGRFFAAASAFRFFSPRGRPRSTSDLWCDRPRRRRRVSGYSIAFC